MVAQGKVIQHPSNAAIDQHLGRPLPLKLSQIVRFEGQPRTYFDDVSIARLADSIMADGQQVPVKVCTNPAQKGVFTLIDGERRYRAFTLIQERTGQEPIIDAFVAVVKDLKEHFKLSTIANLHREDLTELDEAAALFQLQQSGETLGRLSDLIGKSTTYVTNRIKVHGLPEEVKKLMDPRRPKDERLSITSAIDIATSTANQTMRLELANEIVTRNLGVNDARALVGIRAENAGYRPGGRLRVPADDYKALTSFLGRTQGTIARLGSLDMEGLYFYRDNEKDDREKDAKTVRFIIAQFQRMLGDLEKKPKE